MQARRFDGEFLPPSVPGLRPPVPMAGTGAIELDADGLRATGFRSRGPWLALLAMLVTGAAGFGGAYLVVHFAFHRPMDAAIIGSVIVAGALAGLATPRGATRAPFERRWAWSAIAKSDLAQSREHPSRADRVVITVVDGGRKRTLHFQPTGGPGALYAEIEAKRG